jgi:glutamate--cysteine ligase
LRDEVPRSGLAARVAGRDLRVIAREALDIARAGLARRARSDAWGRDETIYLAPLDEIVADGRVPAQRWIERFNGAWGRRVDPAFVEATI